jgi:flagellar assembly protein FliH
MKMDQRVDQLAEKQVSSIKDQAYKVGEEEGKKRAYSDALLEYQDNFNKNIMKIEKFVQEINNEKNNIFESFRANLLNLITSTTKWVIVNEIKKDEKAYIERLLEKMILEVDSFQNLLIKIDKKSFEGYEELLAETENKVGKLKNIRVEVLNQTNYPGIIVESDKTILDGTIEAQFEKINKLAENVFERDN